MNTEDDPVLRGELHRIEADLVQGDLDIWAWFTGGFEAFLVWCGRW